MLDHGDAVARLAQPPPHGVAEEKVHPDSCVKGPLPHGAEAVHHAPLVQPVEVTNAEFASAAKGECQDWGVGFG